MLLRPPSTNLPRRASRVDSDSEGRAVRQAHLCGGGGFRWVSLIWALSVGAFAEPPVVRALLSCAVGARVARNVTPRSHWSQQVLHNTMQISAKLGDLLLTAHIITVQGDVQAEPIQGNTNVHNFLLTPFYTFLYAQFLHYTHTYATGTVN